MRLYQMEQEDRERLLLILGFEVWRARSGSGSSSGAPEDMSGFSGAGESVVRSQSFQVG